MVKAAKTKPAPIIDRLVVVGLGLIGGSFAKGLRESGLCREVVGVDLDYETIQIQDGGSMLMVSASGTAVVIE